MEALTPAAKDAGAPATVHHEASQLMEAKPSDPPPEF
jgi:hypothetical protein